MSSEWFACAKTGWMDEGNDCEVAAMVRAPPESIDGPRKLAGGGQPRFLSSREDNQLMAIYVTSTDPNLW
jgi:hypothetical protein